MSEGNVQAGVRGWGEEKFISLKAPLDGPNETAHFRDQTCICSRRPTTSSGASVSISSDATVQSMPVIGMYRSISSLHFVEWRDVVQCPVYQQLRQHGQLLDRQGDVATRTLKLAGKVGAHDVERGEGFAGVGEQGRCVDVGADREYVADGVEVIGVAEAGADGGFGGFGEVG